MKRKKSSSKSVFLTIISLIILVVLIVSLINYILNYIPGPEEFVTNMTFEKYSSVLYDYEIMRCPSKAKVTYVESGQERIGIGVVTDPWNLNFGSMPVSSSYARFIDLVNLGEKEAMIIFRAYGNITPFVEFSSNNFILYQKENVTIKVNFNSKYADVGNYTGEIDRIVKIPKYDFLYIFW